MGLVQISKSLRRFSSESLRGKVLTIGGLSGMQKLYLEKKSNSDLQEMSAFYSGIDQLLEANSEKFGEIYAEKKKNTLHSLHSLSESANNLPGNLYQKLVRAATVTNAYEDNLKRIGLNIIRNQNDLISITKETTPDDDRALIDKVLQRYISQTKHFGGKRIGY